MIRLNLCLAVLLLGATAASADIRQLALPAKDLVYNPVTQKLYASVPAQLAPGIAGSGNSIVSIDPATGKVGAPVPIGENPGKLALSDDGRYLYVALNGAAAAVRRFDLTTQTADPPFTVSGDRRPGTTSVGDMQVAPGHPETVAVVLYDSTSTLRTTGLVRYENGVPQVKQAPWPSNPVTIIAFGRSGDRLYGFDTEVSPPPFTRMAVDASGLTVLDSASAGRLGDQMRFAGGVIYGGSGLVIEPETRQPVETFSGVGYDAVVAPDLAAGRVYFLTLAPQEGIWSLRTFDARTFLPLGVMVLPQVKGQAISLVRWGEAPDGTEGGLAFRTNTGQLFLIDLAPPAASGADLALSAVASPASVAQDRVLALTVTVTNAGPGAATGVTLTQSLPALLTDQIVSIAMSQGSCRQMDSQIVCSLGGLAAGAQASVTLVVKLGTANPAGIPTWSDTASVTANEPDPNPTNNQLTETLTVLPRGSGPLAGATLRILTLAANDLVYDPATQRLYASVPSRAGADGNSVTAIDPETGQTGPSVFVGSEPGRLALSDDGQYLYVALDGASAARRLDVAQQKAELPFSLGSDRFFGPFFASDMSVAPGHPETVAVARPNGGVAVYDNGVPRPKQTPSFDFIVDVTYGSSAGRLYGSGSTSTSEFDRMSVDATGITLLDNAPVGPLGDIQFAGGLIYGSLGLVIDPETRAPVGTFSGVGSPSLVAPDTAAGRAYFLTGMDLQPERSLLVFDSHTFLALGSMPVEDVAGGAHSLIRWGQERSDGGGLAFVTDGGQVFLIALNSRSAPPPDFSLALSPSSASGDGTVTATVTLTAPAPPGGFPVALASSNPAAAAVPAALTVSAGALAASVGVTVHPVPSPTDVMITASAGGVTRTATLHLTPSVPPPPSALAQLRLFPNPVPAGMPALGEVILTGPAGRSGLTVPLTSSYPAFASVPATITVPPGASAATFAIATYPLTGSYPVTITAGPPGGQVTAMLVVVALTAPVLLTPTAQPFNLLVNGSFEEPVVPAGLVSLSLTGVNELPGWRLVRGSVEVIPDLPAGWQPAPDGGSQSLVLVGGSEASTIEQTFPTEPGRSYLFSGWISHIPGTMEAQAAFYLNGQFLGEWDHSEKYDGTVTPTDMRWVRFVLSIHATGPTTTLTIGAYSSVRGVLLDGLAVTPVDPQNPSATPATAASAGSRP